MTSHERVHQFMRDGASIICNGASSPCVMVRRPHVMVHQVTCCHEQQLNGVQVVWLDVVAARARYGRWIGGTLPTFVPVPLAAGKATAKARKGNKPPERQPAAEAGEEEQFAIRLKQLRCEQLPVPPHLRVC